MNPNILPFTDDVRSTVHTLMSALAPQLAPHLPAQPPPAPSGLARRHAPAGRR
jgi:hypothetical protein